jgi:hypothetical protein
MATTIDAFVAPGESTIGSPDGLWCFLSDTNLGLAADGASAFEPVGGDDWEEDDLDDEEDDDLDDEEDEDHLDEDEDEEDDEDDNLDEAVDA